MSLTPEQRQRYARHLVLDKIGEAGQERLLSARVLVVGAGGLGSPAALYLAAAGVGVLGVADSDRVDLSNLQRQILHGTRDIGRPKAASARERLAALNPDVEVRLHPDGLNQENAERVVAAYDFVVDATDNFDAKFLIADTCHRVGRPYSHAGIARFYGQALTVVPGRTACYRCVFESPPPPDDADRHPAGPVGAVAGVLGAIQANEAIKCVLGLGELLTNRLLTFDALTSAFRTLPVSRRPDCALCGRTE